MFSSGKQRKQSKSIEVTKLSSLIADNVHIVGDVVFSGGLRIDGRIEGNVINQEGSHGLLVLSEKGSVKGRVATYDAVVNGMISGDLVVDHFLELQANARVSGNIVYRQLQMECGAVIEGRVERIDEEASQEKKGDEKKNDEKKVVDLTASQPFAVNHAVNQ